MTVTPVADNYTQAVTQGDYDLYVGNLFGKYDNVRVYWEDQLTRLALRPFISQLVSDKGQANQPVRVLDLGCGTGQGYEILRRIDKRDADLDLHHDRVLPDERMVYLGLDLSQAMVDKGQEIYADTPQVRFVQADLSAGLAALKSEERPFDIYFSTYGSPSHLNTEQLYHLLTDICDHSQAGSLVVLDLLGRYSIEWPTYWTAESEAEKVRDYQMSYLHSEFGRPEAIEHFPMRFWAGREIETLVADLQATTGTQIEILKKMDRSLLVGRHVDTGDYNPNLKPIRRLVNRLHQDYMRTDLETLIIDRTTFPEHPEPTLARVFDELVASWNSLVRFCQDRLTNDRALVELADWSDLSAALQLAIMTLDRVINDAAWMWNGDPRANIIEPQLGYALRSLEASLQPGLGCGHGMLVILRITK